MPDHRLERALLCLILLVGAAIRARFALMDPLLLEELPIDEDAFYYFNIARNIASGVGVRHDSFHLTNGFQPFFGFLLVPIFAWIRDPLQAVSAVMWLQIAIGVGCGLAIHRLVALASGPAPALFAVLLWALSSRFVFGDINGLETSTAFLLLCLSSHFYLTRFVLRSEGAPGPRDYAGLGLLLGLGFLARVDLGLVAIAMMGDGLWRARGDGSAKTALRGWLLCGACALGVALPWLLYGMLLIGSPMPSSGQAVRFMSQAYGFRMLNDVSRTFPIGEIPADYYRETLRLGLEALRSLLSEIAPVWLGLPLLAAAALLGGRSFWNDIGRLRFLLGFVALLFCAYVFYVFGQWYFERYFRPMTLAYLMLLGIGFRHLATGRVGGIAAVGLAVLSVVWIVPQTWQEAREITERSEPGWRSGMARFVNETLPKDAVIGAFQSGIVGYYLERRFVSLDGKTNIDALRAMQDGRMDKYLETLKVDYVMDWPWILRDLLERRSVDPGYLRRQKLVARRYYWIYALGADQRRGRRRM